MLWLKAFHIIFIVCWFAGIFYLPRLFVYYAGSAQPETRAQLLLMARRLYRFITPLALLAVGFGIALTNTQLDYYLDQRWFYIKLALVAALIAYHWQCGRYIAHFSADRAPPSARFFRLFNELPVLALFAIVILVVIKPYSA